MNCEQAGQKMQELLDGEIPGPLKAALLAHCDQCESCHSDYRALLLLTTELRQLPSQEPGPDFRSALMSKLEHETVKPLKVSDLLLASTLLMAPVLAVFVSQLLVTGSSGPLMVSGRDMLSSLIADFPVIDSLELSFSASYGYYTLRAQAMIFALALIALAFICQAKPHKNIQ